MLIRNHSAEFRLVHISEIEVGVTLVNLGTLLEIEEHSLHYRIIINRMDEKQVFKFNKDTYLYVE